MRAIHGSFTVATERAVQTRSRRAMGEGAEGPSNRSILFRSVSFQDPVSEGNQALNFTVKETVCPAEEDFSADRCDFKEDGVSDRHQAGLDDGL